MPYSSLRNQDITYWDVTGLDAYGQPSYDTPVTVKGRWEDRTVLIDSEDGGESISSNARVWLPLILSKGAYVYLGESSDASPPTGSKRVIRSVNVPSVDNRRNERQHFLD